MIDLPRRGFLGAALLVPLAACAAPAAPVTAPPPDTGARFADLERRFDARLGVHALDTGSGSVLAHRADERFPLCSTFKVLAVGALLDRTPPAHLDTRVRYTAAQLVDGSPVTSQHVGDGMTIRELCDAAIRYSDNTAGNLLLADLGGPGEVTAFARALGDPATRLDRTEPTLNQALPGDERDTTTPAALGGLLRELVLGTRLDDADRALLTGWLLANTTGGTRIRAGVPAGWRVADKTGTGRYASANDIAVLYPPDRAPIVLAVLTTRPQEDATADSALLSGAATAVVDALAH